MLYYRCKCGDREAWGSMPPNRCSGCPVCGMNLSPHPDMHKTPEPHNFVAYPVDSDQGGATITRCAYCMKTKAQIEQQEAICLKP